LLAAEYKVNVALFILCTEFYADSFKDVVTRAWKLLKFGICTPLKLDIVQFL